MRSCSASSYMAELHKAVSQAEMLVLPLAAITIAESPYSGVCRSRRTGHIASKGRYPDSFPEPVRRQQGKRHTKESKKVPLHPEM